MISVLLLLQLFIFKNLQSNILLHINKAADLFPDGVRIPPTQPLTRVSARWWKPPTHEQTLVYDAGFSLGMAEPHRWM